MQYLRKIYYFIRELIITFRAGNMIFYSFDISNFYLKANINNQQLFLPLRSFKILKRLNNFKKQ